MRAEFARLPLLQEVATKPNGVMAQEVVVYRPTCRTLTDVYGEDDVNVQVKKFIESSSRAFNGTAEPLEFSADELASADFVEFGSIMGAMREEADETEIGETGDGFKEPLVYTLKYPVVLSQGRDGAEPQTIRQIMFESKKMKDLTDYLDAEKNANSETKTFHAFMQAFAKPLGVAVPVMSPSVIDAMDYLDYLVIRRKIMGKFMGVRRKWKRAS